MVVNAYNSQKWGPEDQEFWVILYYMFEASLDYMRLL